MNEEEQPTSTGTIKSVERAARMLGFFTPSRPKLTLNELTARLGVSKPTAHRYAMALRKVNLLRYDRSAAEYTLGPQVLTLAAAARSGLPIINLAGPIMEHLVHEVNQTAVLSVWDGEHPVVVRVDDSTERLIRISVRAGARLELESSQARVFAAYLPNAEVPVTDSSSASDHESDELDLVRRSGVAISSADRHGVRTIAAPVFNEGQIVAVLALIGTVVTLADDVDSLEARALKAAAQRLTDEFGTSASGGS